MTSHMVVEKAEGKRAKIMQLVIDGVSNLNAGLTHSKTHLCLLFTYLPINLFFFPSDPGKELLFMVPVSAKSITNLNLEGDSHIGLGSGNQSAEMRGRRDLYDEAGTLTLPEVCA